MLCAVPLPGQVRSSVNDHLQKWRNWWAEYVTLEPIDVALKDEKIIAATKHYGIELASPDGKDKE